MRFLLSLLTVTVSEIQYLSCLWSRGIFLHSIYLTFLTMISLWGGRPEKLAGGGFLGPSEGDCSFCRPRRVGESGVIVFESLTKFSRPPTSINRHSLTKRWIAMEHYVWLILHPCFILYLIEKYYYTWRQEYIKLWFTVRTQHVLYR